MPVPLERSKCGASRSARRSAVSPSRPDSRRCVGRMTRPGSLMPTRCIRHEVRGRLGVVDLARLAALLEVAQGRLVAVVAVGDEHRLRADEARDDADRVLVVQRPEAVDDAERVGRLQRQAPADAGGDGRGDLVGGVGVEAEDRAEVHARRVHELQAVGLRAGERLLVGEDAARAERLQPDAGHEPLAGQPPALGLELLLVDVERPRPVLHQHVLAEPLAQGVRRARVAVVGLGVGRGLALQDEADDVVRTSGEEALLHRRVDHVIRRGDHVAERPHPAQVVAIAAKGS